MQGVNFIVSNKSVLLCIGTVVHHDRHSFFRRWPHDPPNHLLPNSPALERSSKSYTFKKRKIVSLRKDAAVAHDL